jgi:ribosomal protein S18 acetylase RimI-like enzyme
MQDPNMPSKTPVWDIRPARADDRSFLVALHEVTMRSYVDATWGWDDEEQRAFFDAHFDPRRCQILQVDGVDVGVLAVEELVDEICLAEIQLLPAWQGKGIGSAVVRSLAERGAADGKPVTLRVLHANPRAAAFYTRLGFRSVREIETHVYMQRDP